MLAEILQAAKIGKMTALQKPHGGERGIAVRDFIRRLVARTVAQQLGPAVEQHTSPFLLHCPPDLDASTSPTSLKR